MAQTETTPVPTMIKHAIRARIIAGQRRWRWDLNPRKGCPFTGFRVLRTPVHRRPPAFMTSPNRRPTAAGERPRTGVNEPKTELSQYPGGAAGPMGRLAADRVTQALRLEDATDRGRTGG